MNDERIEQDPDTFEPVLGDNIHNPLKGRGEVVERRKRKLPNADEQAGYPEWPSYCPWDEAFYPQEDE